MVGYLDSSVLLQYILEGDESIGQVLTCDSIVSSELMEIECRRVIHRCRLSGDLDDEGFLTAIDRLEKVLKSVSLILLSPSVKKRAAESFPVVIKTLDALHLASAVKFQDIRKDESLLIFSFDKSLNRCAKAFGFTVPFYAD